MANHLLSFFLCFFLFFFSSSFFSEAQSVPAIFVIGDSLVDVGNNNYLPVSYAKANFPRNGIDFPTKEATGRFSNGKNAADFASEKFGLPTSPPFLAMVEKNNASFDAGVSFASGGAGILNSTDPTFGQSIPLVQQVTDFITVRAELLRKLGAPETQKLLSRSLFIIVIGSNDLFDYFRFRPQITPRGFVDNMLSTLKEQIKRLHMYGARKFLFTGVPVIGCVPEERVKNETGDCNQEKNFWATKYNEGLVPMLRGLKSELQGMNYTYFDTYSFMQKIIENPSTYGFSEIKSACCGLGTLKAVVPCLPVADYCPNRTDHLFWDLYHPTETAYRIFADAIYDGSEYTFPINLRQLASAP
ncbi:hypothetical protein SLE2022_397020 [Rubroshorea leprosula]